VQRSLNIYIDYISCAMRYNKDIFINHYLK